MSGTSSIGSHVLMVVVLCTAVLAGCIGSTDPSAGAGDTDAAASVATLLELDGCREILGYWELPYEDVKAYLPPGFETYGGGFLGSATGANVTMDVLAFGCTEPEEAAVLLPWLYAEPPAHLFDAETEAYRLALPCIGDAAIVEGLQAWGIPCITAEAEMTVEAETPTAAQWAFQAENTDLSIRLEGQGVDGGETSIEPVFGQFHAIDGELCAFTQVRLEDHIHWRGEGYTLEVDGDAPFPVPDAPGRGLLSLPDIWMNVTPVARAADAGSNTSACPAGQMPPGSSTLPTAQAPWNRTTKDTLSDGSPIPAGFDLTACEEQGGTFAADPGRAGELPEGFSHVPSDPAEPRRPSIGSAALARWRTTHRTARPGACGRSNRPSTWPGKGQRDTSWLSRSPPRTSTRSTSTRPGGWRTW